ncbi:hypothetical protein P4U99_25920 [Brevibacillus agri]|uniref:hypothetical protein n=1 Tax=Brevibacillus agri TaxID=51101 RepID=UPI002E21ED19|nr:hypothetical protein [Brevibacillus agri]MED1657809.1 hypothetical protein [Brevibacillus agri]MED1690225.1 hypothetical protein [Brevibacillus agri]MED1695336.1 hypothetical protein [Brevibacillus agri]MED1700836.1 hypothetical protein [Brevibacillus agri]
MTIFIKSEHTKREYFEFKRKKEHVRIKTNISPSNLDFHDSISGSSHSKVIEYHNQTRYSVAYDIENDKEGEYKARGLIVCEPVNTLDEFKAIFMSHKITKVKLNVESVKDLLKSSLVLEDGTKISKDWLIEFGESKSYPETDRFVNIIRRFLEFIHATILDVDSVIFQTEDSQNVLHIYPKPNFKQLSVPHREEIFRLLAPHLQGEAENDLKIRTALGVWTSFFLKNPQHAFLESMEKVMRPYEHKAKNDIISDRVDFLAGMIKVVHPDQAKFPNGDEKNTGRLLRDQLKALLKGPRKATELKYNYMSDH